MDPPCLRSSSTGLQTCSGCLKKGKIPGNGEMRNQGTQRDSEILDNRLLSNLGYYLKSTLKRVKRTQQRGYAGKVTNIPRLLSH
ncbi:hypothetical protein FKM82_023262 [Ascaphus truei]